MISAVVSYIRDTPERDRQVYDLFLAGPHGSHNYAQAALVIIWATRALLAYLLAIGLGADKLLG